VSWPSPRAPGGLRRAEVGSCPDRVTPRPPCGHGRWPRHQRPHRVAGGRRRAERPGASPSAGGGPFPSVSHRRRRRPPRAAAVCMCVLVGRHGTAQSGFGLQPDPCAPSPLWDACRCGGRWRGDRRARQADGASGSQAAYPLSAAAGGERRAEGATRGTACRWEAERAGIPTALASHRPVSRKGREASGWSSFTPPHSSSTLPTPTLSTYPYRHSPPA